MSEREDQENESDSSNDGTKNVAIPGIEFYEEVTKVYEPISNPKRALILDMIREGQTIAEIEDRFDMTRQGLQRHFDKLKSSDLIKKDPDGGYTLTTLGEHAGRALDQAKEHHRSFVKARVAERYTELAAEVEHLASLYTSKDQGVRDTPDQATPRSEKTTRELESPRKPPAVDEDVTFFEADTEAPFADHAQGRRLRRPGESISEVVASVLETYFEHLEAQEGGDKPSLDD